MLSTHLREAIREERERQGMTRVRLAALAGCSESTIRKIEGGPDGENVPSVDLADKILRALGLYMRVGAERSRRKVAA